MQEGIAEMDHVACEAHRALVARAFADDATDDEVARYAAEVPTCPACHAAKHVDGWWVRLRRGLARPVPAPHLVWIGAAGIALAVAIVLSALRSPEPPARPAAPPPARAPTLPPPPAAQASPDDLPPADEPEVATAPPPAVQGLADAVANALEVALAEPDADLPMPPYVDLRGAAGPLGAPANAVRLELSGEAAVGDSVGLAVVTGVPTELAVCVTGPRPGVVWRGAVPAGRTTLSRDGHAERFRFDAPGAWRFALSADPGGCDAPVHTVDVVVE